MNTIRKSILAGLVAVSMGNAAFAAAEATDAGAGHAAGKAQMQAGWGEHVARRQAALHDALKLMPAQESAWNAYRATIRPAAGERHGERAAWAALPAPARMEKMIAMSKQRTAMMEARLPALSAFYATLTPEQKKVFDQQARHGRHDGHRGHGGPGKPGSAQG